MKRKVLLSLLVACLLSGCAGTRNDFCDVAAGSLVDLDLDAAISLACMADSVVGELVDNQGKDNPQQ